MLDQITPLILTYNEQENIARTLAQLTWAQRVVVVDSLSDDDTLNLIKQFPNVQVYSRAFDCHEKQWNYGRTQTGIDTPWVLALDADYVLSDALIDELSSLQAPPDINAYWVSFKYVCMGKQLSASMYPPVMALYRQHCAAYFQDGHTQRLKVEGKVGRLRQIICHDDRKPLSRWLRSQDNYTRLESQQIVSSPFSRLNRNDKLRKLIVVTPFIVLIHCLIFKRCLFEGRPGIYYAFQRTLAELLLSLRLLEQQVLNKK